MSGYLTHMSIGAAGGVLLARAAPELLPGDPALTTLALPLVSAVAATWPDIDHPDAWASRRAGPTLALVGAVVAMAMLGGEARTLVELAALAALGALVAALLGSVLLWALRIVAGGHRGGTHSLIAPGLLLLAALALSGTGAWAWLPLLFVWGWLLHILGDVVTPGGWRPLAPFRGPTLRLPRAVARHGETVVSAVALAICAAGLGLHIWLGALAGAFAALALAARRRARRAG